MGKDSDIVKRKLLGLEICPKCGKEVKTEFSPRKQHPNGLVSSPYTLCPSCNQVISWGKAI